MHFIVMPLPSAVLFYCHASEVLKTPRMRHLFELYRSHLASYAKKIPFRRKAFFLVARGRLGTPAGKLIFLICISCSGGSSSRRKVQTSHFAKRFAKLNARFHQLPAPNSAVRISPLTQKKIPFRRKAFFLVARGRFELSTQGL